MAVEGAEEVCEERAHVASALTAELEVGLDRIDLLRLLHCLRVFELFDENVLDVDGDGVEEIERICEGLSGVSDKCCEDVSELSATQRMRRGITIGGQRKGQIVNVVHVHVLQYHDAVHRYFEKRLGMTDGKRNHAGKVNVQILDGRDGRHIQLFLQKRTYMIHIFS